MSSVNKIFLLGNVGKEPETRAFANGDGVTSFSLATSDSWKDKASGELKSVTEWHNVVCYRKLSEIAARIVKQGSKVFVEGKLKTRKWEGKDGVTHYKTEIEANQLLVLDKKTGEVAQSASDVDVDIPF